MYQIVIYYIVHCTILVVQSAGCITGVDHQAEPGKVTVAGLQWLGDETKR